MVMRTTITVDDALVEQAVELSRVHEKAALIRTALQTLCSERPSTECAWGQRSAGRREPSTTTE
jgi:Arc/MetJ family transcription regulator